MKFKNSQKEEIELPADAERLYIMMTQAALGFLNRGLDKDKYVMFASEIWDSMEMSNPKELQLKLNKLYMSNIRSMLGPKEREG